MTITEASGSAAPGRHERGISVETAAAIGVAEWLRVEPAAAEEHEEAMRAGTHRDEMQRRWRAAAGILADAKVRVSNLKDKADLAGRRALGFGLGAVVVVALITLDAIPLNWAAQAFGLDAADSWLVTMILLAASVGIMAGLEITRNDRRRRAMVVAIMMAGYAGLLGLRTSFLVTVAGELMITALLQAFALSAMSAGLVLLGSAVMARTRSLRLSRARAAVRRAERACEASEHAWRQADERFLRHLGVLRRQLARQSLYSAVPAGITHAEWAAALERALRVQFPAQ